MKNIIIHLTALALIAIPVTSLLRCERGETLHGEAKWKNMKILFFYELFMYATILYYKRVKGRYYSRNNKPYGP